MMIEIKEAFHLYRKFTRFTFRQNHVKGYIERRLDFFFVSNILQESITKTDIIASHFSDHSLRLLTLKLDKGSQK